MDARTRYTEAAKGVALKKRRPVTGDAAIFSLCLRSGVGERALFLIGAVGALAV